MKKIKPSKKSIKDYFNRYGLVLKEIWISSDKKWKEYCKLYEELH